MNESTRNVRELAERLIALEARDSLASGAKDSAALVSAVEKLRRPLAAFTGVAGFRSLLSRALALAGSEIRWLRGVHIKSDGSLDCPEGMAQIEQEQINEGMIALIAHLFGLLVTFIGEPLTFRLLEEACPEISIEEDRSPGKRSRKEET